MRNETEATSETQAWPFFFVVHVVVANLFFFVDNFTTILA